MPRSSRSTRRPSATSGSRGGAGAVDAALTARWPDLRHSNELRSTPILVEGVLYASNGIGLVEAFDPGTGETLWGAGHRVPRGGDSARRVEPGVAYWADGDDRRIFAIRPPHLMAVDAATGRLIESFGDGGLVDLTYDERTGYRGTSPPVVVKDVVILGSMMEDHPFTKEQHPGDVRAYDVRTGALRWTWSPIPRAGEPGVETWLDDSWQYSGMANVWTMFSADLELGYVYLPTGAPTNDMYGGHRPATTSMRTAWSASTPQPASASGTSRWSTTTCGTTTTTWRRS